LLGRPLDLGRRVLLLLAVPLLQLRAETLSVASHREPLASYRDFAVLLGAVEGVAAATSALLSYFVI
jgi:hypothetical protein